MTTRLTVAMITMNEAGAVRQVVEEIRAAAGDAEILLVDSSADATPQIAAELGCRVLRQFPPRGYGPAMTRALREASGDVVVTLDCDGTYPAETIPELVARVEAGADLVNASRLQRRPRAMPFPNYLANRLFAWTARLLYGDAPPPGAAPGPMPGSVPGAATDGADLGGAGAGTFKGRRSFADEDLRGRVQSPPPGIEPR